jgi:HEPN domain-containing protein
MSKTQNLHHLLNELNRTLHLEPKILEHLELEIRYTQSKYRRMNLIVSYMRPVSILVSGKVEKL